MKSLKNMNQASKLITMICLTLTIFTITVITTPQKAEETISTNSTLSNQKIGWGIKRNDTHNQPDLGSTNQKLIN